MNAAIAELDLQDFAVGNDMVYLPDFKSSFNSLFQKKVYTEREVAYCELFDQPMLRFASTWAAKEAVYKAVKQLVDDKIAFIKIEINRPKIAGIPKVNLPEQYADIDVSLSITHDGDYACSVAIAKRRV